ncbi:MAG: creatininase [Planctomycetaceae bacterium]|nr:creatininase [Planctomycetaceae bacterium]
MRPWILAEANYAYVKENPYEVAVLPFGATEPHNLHLPYGTDLFEATILGEKICQAAHENGARPVLLPTIPYGTETNMHALPLAMNLNPSTLTQVTTDLVASLVDSNIRKVVLLNSHGGNGLKPLLRELYNKTEARLFLCNWFEVLADIYDEIFSEKEDHAGEMETSFGMAFFPELVIRNEDGSLAADEGATRESRFEAINRGWVSITRPWQLLTTNSGSGNPHAATKEKGEQMMQHLVERLGAFLVELSAAEIDDHFPFKP